MKKKPKAVILQSRAKQSSPAAPLAPDLSVDDSQNWKFDEVDESELVACCYWEYARESALFRGAVETAKTAFANERIPKPVSEEREAFRVAANKAFGLLIQTGFDISFWVGPPFPKPWQAVDNTEREMWANGRPEIPSPVKFQPFQVTGDHCIAGALYEEAKKIHETRQALNYRLSQIDSGADNLKEAAEVRKQLAEQVDNPTPVVLHGMGGMDSFIAQINWAQFNNDKIAEAFRKWVKPNRPKNILKPSGQGHGPREWRARLTRLAAMRLLHSYTGNEILGVSPKGVNPNRVRRTNRTPPKPRPFLSEEERTEAFFDALADRPMAKPLPECRPVLEAEQFCGDTWLEPENWYDARRKALKDFHWLLPFLQGEMPLSEQTKGSMS
jgi:hypothetical protein